MKAKQLLSTKRNAANVTAIRTLDIERQKRKKFSEIAFRINQELELKGIKRTQFADMMSVQPSLVSRWLSGHHNFTLHTLCSIEFALDTDLFNINHSDEHHSVAIEFSITYASPSTISTNDIFFRLINYKQEEHKEIKIIFPNLPDK